MKNRIRIESYENVVTNAKIVYVPDEGVEVDISDCVQAVDLRLHVGEVATATLQTILVSGSVTAEVEDVIVKRLAPMRRFRRTRRFWQRLVRSLKRGIARSLNDEVRREIARTARQRRSA